MLDLSKTVEQCSIWKQTLSPKNDDPHRLERERLRASFMSFRERVSMLASEIAKDLPDLTLHDISHLDALWEVASQIVGPDFLLTPPEGYILGGSILLHDLAMSVAATPGGLNAIKSDVRWRDTIYAHYKVNHLREPTEDEIQTPTEDVKQIAIFSLLRQMHAENAERLAFLQFGLGTSSQYLIEDTELRQTYGRIIGQIAHSHWWSLTEVEQRFDRQIGAPHWAPSTWTIDPLKVACILRAADAAHVDARRAPSFRKVFSNINPISRIHWDFQERLNKSYVTDDSLVFTSGQAFSLDDANAWWLCLDTLKMVDAELRAIDSLLSDRSMARFTAKRVAGVDSPERLALYVQTSDWHPIHAAVHLSDLPRIIRSLGGEELYGKDPTVPLRELIQNSSDAIRARRFYESRDNDFGEIIVSLSEKDGISCLRVEDNGIGMSKRVLTQYLLDFGCSFWSKPQVQEEFPGLLSSGFQSTGKYGIGFFSVFMSSDRVKIITRRPDAAASDSLVLEFGSGLAGRPILRPARKDEQLRDGGTVIELVLRTPPEQVGGLLRKNRDSVITLLTRCREIAPTLDVKLIVLEDKEKRTAIEPQDWIHIPGDVLLVERTKDRYNTKYSEQDFQEFAEKVSPNLRILNDEKGNPIARICITASTHYHIENTPSFDGYITVGGFIASPLNGIAGFIIGETTRAARDKATPLIPKKQLADWATEQASLIPNIYTFPETQVSAAQVIRICGGNTRELPIASYKGQWLSALQIAALPIPDKIVILDRFIVNYSLKHSQNLVFDEGVFVTNASGYSVVFQDQHYGRSHDGRFKNVDGMPLTLHGAVIEAAAQAWGVSYQAVLEKNDLEQLESEVRIGQSTAGEVRERALILCKP